MKRKELIDKLKNGYKVIKSKEMYFVDGERIKSSQFNSIKYRLKTECSDENIETYILCL